MNDIHNLNCPHCDNIVEAPVSILGQKAICPHCEGKIILPTAKELGVTTTLEIQPPETIDKQEIMSQKSYSMTSIKHKPCLYCSEEILSTAKKCKHCGEMQTTLQSRAVQEKKMPCSRQKYEQAQIKYYKRKNREAAANQVGCLLILLIVIIPMFCTDSCSSNNKAKRNKAKKIERMQKENAKVISLYYIASDYAKNEVAASKKYGGKYLLTWGTITNIRKAYFGSDNIVTLATIGGATADYYFDINHDVTHLKKGDFASIIGKFSANSFCFKNCAIAPTDVSGYEHFKR